MDENPTDVDEQYELGLCYFDGNGVPQDMKKAMYWFSKAAEQGRVEAQVFLGCHYAELEEYKKAAYWHSKAAKQGNAVAQYNMGALYENGDGVSEDLEKAVYWYTKAAEQGNEDAQQALDDLQ